MSYDPCEPERELMWCHRHDMLKPCEECRGEAQLRQQREAQQSSRANHFKRQPVPRTRSLPRTTQNR